MDRMRRSLALLATAALLGSCTRGSGASVTGVVAESKPFPPLTGVTVQGGTFETSGLAGRPFVLNVWATWCGPCRREQPALQRVHDRYGDRVGFVGVNYRDDEAKARDWVREFGVSYPSLSDPSGRFAATLGFPFLPDTYVVDASGTIRYVVYGETDEQEITGLIDRVLGSGPGTS